MNNRKSYVYCIQERSRDANAPIKIGIARSPEQRLTNMQVGNPMLLAIYGLIGPMSDADAAILENEIHINMSKHRIRGEWFSGRALSVFDKAQRKHGVTLVDISPYVTPRQREKRD